MAGRLAELENETNTEPVIDATQDAGDTDEAPANVVAIKTAPAAAETESQYSGLMITATPEFKAAVKQAAENADKSISAFVRDLIAKEIEYSGPMSKDTKRVRKYSTEEERAAAQKARNKTRRDTIKALLEKYGEEFKAMLDPEDDGDDEEGDDE